MLPTLFEFELFKRPLAINGYGLMVGLGLVLWTWVLGNETRRLGLDRMAKGTTLTTVLMIAAIYIGGKLLYAITQIGQPDTGGGSPGPGEGFVFYGSLLLAIPTLILRARWLGVPALFALDVYLVAAPLTHAFGRMGCFLAGCCYGHRSDHPLAVTFERGQFNDVAVHPVQLYEAAGLLVLFVFIYFVIRPRKRFDGQITFIYLIGYTILRSLTEIFRGDPDRNFVFSDAVVARGEPPIGISTSVFISIVVAAVSIGLLIFLRRTGRLNRLYGRPI